MLVTHQLIGFEVFGLVLWRVSCPVGCYSMLTWHITEDES